jgi:hypothetical protein
MLSLRLVSSTKAKADRLETRSAPRMSSPRRGMISVRAFVSGPAFFLSLEQHEKCVDFERYWNEAPKAQLPEGKSSAA